MQVASDISAVSVENLPRGHNTHGDDPLSALYVPAAQAAHALPSGPEYPGRHSQPITAPLAFSCAEKDGHGRHWVLLALENVALLQAVHAVAAVDAQILPASHCGPSVVPLLALNVPALHSMQLPPSGPL